MTSSSSTASSSVAIWSQRSGWPAAAAAAAISSRSDYLSLRGIHTTRRIPPSALRNLCEPTYRRE